MDTISLDEFSKKLLVEYQEKTRIEGQRTHIFEKTIFQTLVQDQKWDLLLFAFQNQILELDDNRAEILAKRGELKICRFLHQENYSFSFVDIVRSGNLQTIKWMVDNDINICWDENVSREAARILRFDIVKYLLEIGLPLHSRIWVYALGNGEMKFLNWLNSKKFFFLPGNNVSYLAIDKGNLSSLEWLHHRRINFTYRDYYRALSANQLSVLKWFREHGYSCQDAFESMSISVKEAKPLIWFYENFDIEPFETIFCDFRSFKEFHRSRFPYKSKLQLQIDSETSIRNLQWVIKKGYDFSSTHYIQAVSLNRMDIFNWLIENRIGVKTDISEILHLDLISVACCNLNLYGSKITPTLELLQRLGFVRISTTCYIHAIKHKNFEVLEWLYKNTRILTDILWIKAVKYKQWKVLDWLHHRKCPFHNGLLDDMIMHGGKRAAVWIKKYKSTIPDMDLARCGVYSGHLDILKWLNQEHGVIFNSDDLCIDAVKCSQYYILRWLIHHGAPFGDAKLYFIHIRDPRIELFVNSL